MADKANSALQRRRADAMVELKRGATQTALAMLSELEQQEPADPQIKLDKAAALRIQGDLSAALAATNAALAIDPYFFLALLSQGSILEQMGKNRLAADARPIHAQALRTWRSMSRLPSRHRGCAARSRRARRPGERS